MALLMYAFTSAYSSLLTYNSLGMVLLFSVSFSVCVIISGGEGVWVKRCADVYFYLGIEFLISSIFMWSGMLEYISENLQKIEFFQYFCFGGVFWAEVYVCAFWSSGYIVHFIYDGGCFCLLYLVYVCQSLFRYHVPYSF